MADEVKLYAQFDGDEFDGKRYALGDEVKGLDAGTRDYLVSIGRISAAPPAAVTAPLAVAIAEEAADQDVKARKRS